MNKGILLLGICIVFLVSISALSNAVTIISSCGQDINMTGSYLLNKSIRSGATCLATNASNVEIDCGGYTILYGTAGTASSFGISASASVAQTNLTIKNCIITKNSSLGGSGRGISLTRFANSTIVNNTIMTNGTSSNMGIYIITGSDRNNLSRNTIITSGTSSSNYGISLNAGSADTIIDSNNITTGRGASTTDNYGIYASDPRVNITDNIIKTYGSGDSDYGVYSTGATGTIIVNNTIYTSGASGNNRGIFLSSSNSNYIANNTINTTGQASAGIYLASSNSANVLNNKINSSADAIYLTSSTLSDFATANISRDNTRFGRNITVYGGGALNLPCPNNTIIDNPSDGGLKFISCNNVTIQNWYRPNRDTDGLLFVNSDNNKIINNTLNGGLNGLEMVNSVALCDNNLIANNTLFSYGYIDSYAVRINGYNNTITGNTLTTSGVTSGNIAVVIGNNYNNITNNNISTGGTSGNKGIDFGVAANYNLIENNIINTSGTSGNSGIYFESTNVGNIVRNNTIIAAGTTSGNLGIRLVTNSNGNIIENNTFYTKGLTSGNNGIDLSSSSNNTFRFNNVYAGYGAGTSDNDAISIVSSQNNTFMNNILFANGTATSITSSAVFLQSNSINNTFANNIIIKSVGNAIEIDFSTTYPHKNIFKNNSLNNVSGSDLFFLDASINNTSLVNQPIGKYNFTGTGGTISIENEQFGKIVFTSIVNGTGNNLSSDIQIGFDVVKIADSNMGLNKSANVSLYNLQTNFIDPGIFKDGQLCNDCYNFTSLNAGNVSFNVSSWSNYSIGEKPDITPPYFTTIPSPTAITYGEGFGVLFSASDGFGVDSFSQNWTYGFSINKTGWLTNTTKLPAGSYKINVSVNDTSGNSNSTIYNVIVNKASSQTSLTFDKSSPQDYGTSITPICSILAGGSEALSLTNGTSGTAEILGAGSWNFNCSYDGNENYSSSSNFSTFDINKANPSLIVSSSAGWNVAYGNSAIITGSGCPTSGAADVVCSLFSNNIIITNPKTISDIGVYNIIFNTTGGENYSSASASNILNISDSQPPTIVIYSPENITYTGNSIFLNYSATDDVAVDKCWYQVDGSPNISLPGCATATISGLEDGSQHIIVYANDSYGNLNYSIRYFSIASIPPQWIDMQEDVPLIYSDSYSYFNISWTSSNNLSAVLLEANFSGSFANYSMASLGDNIYFFSKKLPAGSFVWRSFANDSYGNSNWSDYRSITIEKADNPLDLYLNGNKNQNLSITYGIETNATAASLAGDIYLYRDGFLTSNPDIKILGAGTYNYSAYAPGDENYSANSTEFYVFIDRTTSGVDLFLNNNKSDLILDYGTEINVTAVGINGSVILYRDGTLVDNPDIKILAAGTYNYSAVILYNENVSGSMASFSVSVNKASPILNLLLNDNAMDLDRDYGNITNATAFSSISGDADVSYFLYRDGNLVSNPDISLLGAGIYVYNYTSSGGENYTSASLSRTLKINKANPEIRLYINNAEGDVLLDYGNITNATASINLERTVSLLRDNVAVDNQDIKTLGAGTYNYTALSEGDDNYTSAIKSYIITINKIEPSMNLYLDGDESDLSFPVFRILEINASLNAPESSAGLYENDVFVSSGANLSILRNYTSLGDRVWKFSFSGNENYTDKNISYTVSLLDPDFPSYSNLKRSPSSPAAYSTNKKYMFNATWNDNIGIDDVIFSFNGTNYSYSRDEVKKNGGEYYINFTGLGLGTYSYRWIANDTSGNSVSSASQLYTIEKGIAALFLTVSPSNSVVYGTETTVSCSANNIESAPIITRNAGSADNPDIKTLGAGSWNYACTAIATQNYTSASTTSTLIVSKAAPEIKLELNNLSQNLEFDSAGGNVQIKASLLNPGSGFLNLTVDSNLINYGASPVENYSLFSIIGTHPVSAIFDGDENYTSGIQSYNVVLTSGGSGDDSGGDDSGGGGGT